MTHPPLPTLGDLAQVALARYLQQATKYEKAVRADQDPEDLHQMRVGLRRLRTAQQVFAVAIHLPKGGRESDVADVARKLGKLRDLDVINATLTQQYGPALPEAEQSALTTLLAHYQEHRQQVLKQIRKLLTSKRYRKLKQVLETWLQAPTLTPVATLPATMALPDIISPLVSDLWLHPGWLVGSKLSRGQVVVNTRLTVAATNALLTDQSPILHSLRKQVKRVRYQLRLVAEMYGDTLNQEIQRLSEMQTTLGDLQDSQVLAALVEALNPRARAEMPTLFEQLATSRHQAWKQWQIHQKYYLQAEHRQQVRLLLSQLNAPIAPASTPDPTEASTPKADQPASRRRPTKTKSGSTTRKTGRGTVRKAVPVEASSPAGEQEAPPSAPPAAADPIEPADQTLISSSPPPATNQASQAKKTRARRKAPSTDG